MAEFFLFLRKRLNHAKRIYEIQKGYESDQTIEMLEGRVCAVSGILLWA